MKPLNKLKYVLPSVVTAILLCVVYFIKHIYPFGINTVDYYDMAQQMAGFYFHIFDFLHGEKSLFYDPYTALSVNMAMSTSGCSQLSLYNLFFLFVKRDMLLESLSIFLIIKMMTMSFFMYFYIHKRFKLPYHFELFFSVGYAFCGYVLTLYMTIQWLDVAALFPLIMLFLDKLLTDGKIKGYIITLSLALITSYYQSFMILIYIVIMLGIVVFINKIIKDCGDENSYCEILAKDYHLVKLFLATVISMALSSFIFIPQIFQTLASARFNNESEGGLVAQYLKIVSTSKPAYTSRWWSLLLLSFAFAIIVYGLFRFRKEKKIVLASMLALAAILSELIVEGVNLFWHFGSYVGYPIRNGYMIYFTVTVIACRFLEKILADKEKEEISEVLNSSKMIGLAGMVSASSAIVLAVIFFYSKMPSLTLRVVFHLTSAVMAMTFLVYLLLIVVGNNKQIKLSAVVFCAEIVLFSFIMIGKPAFTTGYTEDPEQEGEYIRICSQLDKEFKLNVVDNTLENGKKYDLLFNRVKNPDISLNANYGLALRRPVLSNWTHLLSPKLQRDAKKMGYSIHYTRLLDSGGTVFSDALISISDVLVKKPLDEELYELKDTADIVTDHISGKSENYYLYGTKYRLPFGIVTNSVDYDFENSDIVSLYNSIYSSIVGVSSEIASYEYNENDVLSGDEVSLSTKVMVSGKKALYYFSNQTDTDDYNTRITANGNEIEVPSIGEEYNIYYPAHFNNNLVYLGAYSDETVDIEILASAFDLLGNEIQGEFAPCIISIDLDKMKNLCSNFDDRVTYRQAGKGKYKFSVNSEEDGEYFLLPLSFDEGYRIKVNGSKADAIPVGGMFTAVYLAGGTEDIEITFLPKGFELGVGISLLALAAFLAVIICDRKSDILNTRILILEELYFVLIVLIFVAMYIVPYAFYLLSFLK